MRDRMFPRWGAALAALFPLSEILYVPVTGQTMYAAALASLLCALVCAGAARLAPHWQRSRILQWVLALAALWPLAQSLARMGIFLRETVFRCGRFCCCSLYVPCSLRPPGSTAARCGRCLWRGWPER